MPIARLDAVTASLVLLDQPTTYTAPRGPDVTFRLSYFHRDITQPQIFTYANVGPMWAFPATTFGAFLTLQLPGQPCARHGYALRRQRVHPRRYTGWNRIMHPKLPVIHSDPEILSGTPVFVGTRVPVQSLFDYLEGGDTLDEFLKQFPSVRREQAIAALELARESVLTSARPA